MKETRQRGMKIVGAGIREIMSVVSCAETETRSGKTNFPSARLNQKQESTGVAKNVNFSREKLCARTCLCERELGLD
jgi:hypothetical protein